MPYLFELKRELLDLGYLEMDNTLQELFKDRNEVLIEKDEDNAEKRRFTVNFQDNVIQGRGIKGFFAPIKAERAFIKQTGENEFKIFPFKNEPLNPGRFDTDIDRVNHILEMMGSFRQTDERWFSTFNNAKQFISAAGSDELMCLNQLQRLSMYEYQTKTVLKVFNTFRGRVLLADEVGLGKTIEAGMAMTEYIMRGLVKKVLILVPASLVDQWYYEMKTLFNQDFIRSDDPAFKRLGQDAWEKYNKVIASISSAKRKPASETIARLKYDLIIVDEAHHLKNRKSVAWQFVNSLNKKYIFLLSATPVQNNLEELYNLITLLKPGQLKTYSYFKRNFVGDKEGLKVKNNERLRALLSGTMIRNKRSDIDVKFTKRFATTYNLSSSDREQALYDKISSFIRSKYDEGNKVFTRFILKNMQEQMGSSYYAIVKSLENFAQNKSLTPEESSLLMDFTDEANELAAMRNTGAKLQQMLKIIEDFKDKLLIFTKYKTTQEYIVNFLNDAGISTAIFHGSLRRREKEDQIRYFKEDARVLVSTEAGGEGRNLQFCHGMINYDLPWNPMAIEQRIGRIHRIGQQQDVYVYNLSAKGTLEHYILQILDKKINMFELAVGEVDMILGDMEEAEDFSDAVMNAWVRSDSSQKMEQEIEILGDRLLENKLHYEKIKAIEDKLFAEI